MTGNTCPINRYTDVVQHQPPRGRSATTGYVCERCGEDIAPVPSLRTVLGVTSTKPATKRKSRRR